MSGHLGIFSLCTLARCSTKTPEHLIYRCSGVAFSLRRSLFLMKVVERLRFRAAPQPLHALGRLHFLGIVGRIPEDG